jgi:gas vesicle protein
MNNLFKGAALFLGGALIGATAALLLTPKTGEEVRNEIKDLAEEAKKQVQDYCEKVKQELQTAVAEPAEPKAEEA